MPLNKLHISIIALAFFLAGTGYSQLSNDSSSVASDKLARPQVELGLGALSYFGDIGQLGGVSKRHELNWGYSIAIKNPISNSFGLNIFAMFGSLTANEGLSNESANFATHIRMGGMAITYNFNALLPVERNITPYISAGISTFEFAPKGDLYDANGYRYHYWDDGTIRSMSPSDPNKSTAMLLERDYVYETDLRQEGGSKEKYALRALSIPVGVGVNLKASNAFNVRMGAEYHFGLSDNLDNINNENGQYSTSRKGNDNFLFSSVGLVYNLHYKKKISEGSFEISEEDLLAFTDDEDGDGVYDLTDLCPFSPKGVAVNEKGCPLDSDGDGVADYLDKEKNSAKGAVVDSEGNTLSDEDLENMYLAYIDSTGKLTFSKSQTYTADVKNKELKRSSRSKGYRVEITNTSDLHAEDISKLLSIADIRAEETANGTVYYVGDFGNLEEAVSRKMQLANANFSLRIARNEFGTISAVDESEIASMAALLKPEATDNDAITFRVQIGAYRYRMSTAVFNEVPGLLIVEGNDGLTRYVSGSFTSIRDAAEHKIDLLLKGFEGAFVTAYRGGKRITLKDAGATVNSKEDITTSTTTGNINKKFVKFSVQVGSFEGRVPADVLGKYMDLGNVRPVRGDNGNTKYVYGNYESLADAKAGQKAATAKGFTDAFVVGEFNGQIINSDEAARIKED